MKKKPRPANGDAGNNQDGDLHKTRVRGLRNWDDDDDMMIMMMILFSCTDSHTFNSVLNNQQAWPTMAENETIFQNMSCGEKTFQTQLETFLSI